MADLVSPWVPMTNPLDLKFLGKFAEELGECQAAVARCIIQGIEERQPVTGVRNKDWLADEIADVVANIHLVTSHFKLDLHAICDRVQRKEDQLRKWHEMLA